MSRIVLPTSASVQSRRQYTIEKFFGCDFTNAKLLVKNNRAVEFKNFIRRGQALQKRFGVKEVFSFNDLNKPIHNVFSFVDVNGQERYIANVGGSLYAVETISKEELAFTLIKEKCVLNRKVSAFPCNNRLYILGGIKYLMVSFENDEYQVVELANSKYAYIPTTTIGGASTTSEFNSPTMLDEVNLLTYWKRNKFISGTEFKLVEGVKTIDKNAIKEYKLDTPIKYKSTEDISKISINIEFYDSEENQFTNEGNTLTKSFELKPVLCKGVKLKGFNEEITSDNLITDSEVNGLYVLVRYSSSDFNDSFKEQIKDKVLSIEKQSEDENICVLQPFFVYGYILMNGSIVLFNDYENPNSINNITVEFPFYQGEDSCFIDKCFIGKVYNSNNINSLFCAGNNKFPARDWHSEQINVSALKSKETDYISDNDLVYFPDTSYCDYGEDNKNPILGYDVLGTGDLLVLKKYQKYEPTIYFRTGQLIAVKNDNGETIKDLVGSQLYKPEYSLTTGNIGKSLLNYGLIDNFNGDTIFISEDNSLTGLDKETKSYDNQRYATSRSVFIDGYLKTKNLTNASLYNSSDYLYLINENEIFVSKYGENYEWYRLEYNIALANMIMVNKILYLTDFLGNVYLFENNDVFQDEKFLEIKEGEMVSRANTNIFAVNEKYIDYLEEADKIKVNVPLKELLLKEGEYSLNGSELKVFNEEVKKRLGVNNDEFIYYKGKYYQVDGGFLGIYTLKLINETEILNEDDENIYLIKTEFEIKEIDKENKTITINDFTFNETTSLTGKILFFENVECNYLTCPILFDSQKMNYYKNVHSFTIINDTPEDGEVNVQFVDEDRRSIIRTTRDKGLNFSNLDFNTFDLTRTAKQVKTDTIRKNIFKREYLTLNFFNDSDTNCVLSKVLINYSIGGIIR